MDKRRKKGRKEKKQENKKEKTKKQIKKIRESLMASNEWLYRKEIFG